MHTLKLIASFVGIALIVGATGPSTQAAAKKPKSYASCAALNVVYPFGVAATPVAADAIAAARFVRPTTNKRLYNLNIRLDSPRNGTVCEVAIPIAPPDQVVGLRVIGQTSDRVELSWSAPTKDGGSPITGYKVSGIGGVATVTGTTAVITGLTPGSSYTFSVSAVNVAGESIPSGVSAATPAAPPSTLASAAPSGASTRYANCTAARAAGVTPIRRDTNPDLYAANKSLDRDGDGVACD